LGKICSPCVRATGQGNHFEFIPTVSMESQHSTGSPTCHDFPRFVIVSEKLQPGKKTPYGQIFTNVFQSPTCRHGNTSLCANFVKFGPPEVGEIERCLMDQKKKISARPPTAASARIAPKNLSGTAPNNILGVPQISSKPVHFRRSYSRMREHRSNAQYSAKLQLLRRVKKVTLLVSTLTMWRYAAK